MLKDKTILLGVTGSIAAYKIANLASMLVKQHATVHVIMTRNACHFITPMTFETLTGNKCIVDTFDRDFDFKVEHVSLAKQADVVLVAPATANVIGKISGGICDDMLTTTVCATKAPCIIAPAMNTGMWENPIVQDNIERLKRFGYEIVTPACGRLACGDVGSGKMPDEETLLWHIMMSAAREKDLKGRRVLISAGPTQEPIDPVRYITNHSSGKMGYALAKMAMLRGADVTLVSGPVNLKAHPGCKVIDVTTAEEMFDAVTGSQQEQDIIIMCSAVADYTPACYSEQKMKKGGEMKVEGGESMVEGGEMSLPLRRTKDILQYLGEHKREGQTLVGFSMETENLIENSRRKLEKKNADMICANSISRSEDGQGATGFAVDTNKVTIITRDGMRELPLCSKEKTADMILDALSTSGKMTK